MCVVSGLMACKNKVWCERVVVMLVAWLEANRCFVKLCWTCWLKQEIGECKYACKEISLVSFTLLLFLYFASVDLILTFLLFSRWFEVPSCAVNLAYSLGQTSVVWPDVLNGVLIISGILYIDASFMQCSLSAVKSDCGDNLVMNIYKVLGTLRSFKFVRLGVLH